MRVLVTCDDDKMEPTVTHGISIDAKYDSDGYWTMEFRAATEGRFSGTAELNLCRDGVAEFAACWEGFPQGSEDERPLLVSSLRLRTRSYRS